MSVNREYTREINQSLGYCATWLPSINLALGDVGYMSGFEFRRQGSLKDFGIHFSVGKPSNKTILKHQSKDGVSFETKAAGTVPNAGWTIAQADAGILITFKRSAATLFLATDCTISAIDNQIDLGNKILRLRDNQKWSEDLVVVSEIVLAKSATVLVSKTGSAKVELRANVDVGTPSNEAGVSANQSLNLLNVEGNFNIQHESEMTSTVLANESLTPLFRAIRIQKRFLKPDVVRSLADDKIDCMEETTYEDFK